MHILVVSTTAFAPCNSAQPLQPCRLFPTRFWLQRLAKLVRLSWLNICAWDALLLRLLQLMWLRMPWMVLLLHALGGILLRRLLLLLQLRLLRLRMPCGAV